MPRRRSPALTEAELRIMRALWACGRGTVNDVIDALEDGPRPAYNTVLTVLGILEEKGFVTHEKYGRAFTYVPLVNQRQARKSALSHLLERFFDNSPEALILNLLGREDTDPVEIARVRAMIAEAPRRAPAGRSRR
jgi:BlaI family transcriptional regulator, penicillinase repressor